MSRARVITRKLEVEVEFHQVDLMQVVHNAQYFTWFEKGRLQILNEVMPIAQAIAQKVAMPVVLNYCEYLAPAMYGDQLVVTTRHRIAPQWEGRLRMEHSVSNKKTKIELASGYADVTVIDFETKQPVHQLPNEVWEKYQLLS